MFTPHGELMRLMSIYEVDCLCGKKVQMPGMTGTCENCGRLIELESWQIQHTMTAQGLLVKNSDKKK